ncbi:MAG: hypothetical protein BAJATHORv1_10258 [Candidatus Thorarchaeota archaeon]|nr:MAG: hypothetical protein BAJATHORv1_10258 [Candidatus Thorarchaeota archaeon]
MGRTVRTFRDAVDYEEKKWMGFRRTLGKKHRNNVDTIFDSARKMADAGTMIVTPRTMEVILFSAILEILERFEIIEEKIESLEGRIKERTE